MVSCCGRGAGGVPWLLDAPGIDDVVEVSFPSLFFDQTFNMKLGHLAGWALIFGGHNLRRSIARHSSRINRAEHADRHEVS